jgi:exonuclease V gamma subunit
MVDIRLEGKENISTEEVWEDMKMQVNYLLASLSKASRDYLKLQNKYRDLENDYLKLISSTNFKKG